MSLVSAEHVCPLFWWQAPMAFFATKVGSASSRATFALLPPSSNVTLFTVVAAASLTEIPAPVDPVNETISTSG